MEKTAKTSVLAFGGDSDIGFETLRAGSRLGGREDIFGSGSKTQIHFVDVAIVVAHCNSIRNTGKGNTVLFCFVFFPGVLTG